jgi:hypothetical protein
MMQGTWAYRGLETRFADPPLTAVSTILITGITAQDSVMILSGPEIAANFSPDSLRKQARIFTTYPDDN